MPDRDFPTIVLAIDGLRAAALGAYGQTGYETPGFDALAAESITLDACYAPTPDPADLYRRLAERLGPSLTLVTEAPETTAPLAEAAGRVITLDPPTADRVADSIETTSTAATWMALAEQLVGLVDGDFPDLLWIHTRGLYGPWDAPAELYEPLFDEDDHEVTAGAVPPDELFEDVTSDAACDARFAAGCRYAGQVMTLDACLAGWLDVLDGLLEGEAFRLVVLGLRGFPLGEHGRVGGTDRRLFTEQQHVPVLVRDPDPTRRFTREATPATLDASLLATLADEAGVIDGVAEEVAEGIAWLVSDEAQALVTDEWMLRKPSEGEPELYVKPDDRWEQNDIASREEATAEELLALLAGNSGVAVSRPAT